MIPLYSFWLLMHLLGLALGVGAATVKLRLLLKCKSDCAFVPVYLRVTKSITRIIIAGLILLTLSGIGWLTTTSGYSFTPILITKLVLVLALWVLGPVIDNAVEPKFKKLAPAAAEMPSAAFLHVQRQLLVLETIATGLFYVITFLGVALYP
jgi:hypothetical protein